MLKITFFSLILLFTNIKAYGQEIHQEIMQNLESPNLIGQYDLKVIGLNVYNIKLWSRNKKFSYNDKFAIEINYKMNFSRENLVKRTIEEIKRIQNITDQNELIVYHREFMKIFLDVKKGDCKVAIFTPQKGVELFYNHKSVGKITEPELARYFVDIWLSKNSSYPKMTKTILGESNDY